MDLAGSISPSSGGWSWTWAWMGGVMASGQTVDTGDFPAAGPVRVTLTASNGSCSVSAIQTVNVP